MTNIDIKNLLEKYSVVNISFLVVEADFIFCSQNNIPDVRQWHDLTEDERTTTAANIITHITDPQATDKKEIELFSLGHLLQLKRVRLFKGIVNAML